MIPVNVYWYRHIIQTPWHQSVFIDTVTFYRHHDTVSVYRYRHILQTPWHQSVFIDTGTFYRHHDTSQCLLIQTHPTDTMTPVSVYRYRHILQTPWHQSVFIDTVTFYRHHETTWASRGATTCSWHFRFFEWFWRRFKSFVMCRFVYCYRRFRSTCIKHLQCQRISERFHTRQDSTIFHLPHPEDADSMVLRTVVNHTATSSWTRISESP